MIGATVGVRGGVERSGGLGLTLLGLHQPKSARPGQAQGLFRPRANFSLAFSFTEHYPALANRTEDILAARAFQRNNDTAFVTLTDALSTDIFTIG